MTDRELLELAAKAFGIPNGVFTENFIAECSDKLWGITFYVPLAGRAIWNPLTDDGDALRLAVKLRIYVKAFPTVEDDGETYPAFVEAWQTEDDDPLWVEYEVTDPYAATRRAIVRAAAEIGKALSR